MSISQHRIHAAECPCAVCRRRFDPTRRRKPAYFVVPVALLLALLGAAVEWFTAR